MNHCFQHQRAASGPIELPSIDVNGWNSDEVCSIASKDTLISRRYRVQFLVDSGVRESLLNVVFI